MKASLVRVASTFLLTLAGLVGTGMAQAAPTIKARIPFDFVVGNKSFPAGEYSLLRPSLNLVLLRNDRGTTIALAFTQGLEESNQAPLSSVLRFEVKGGRRVLIEAWTKDEPEGMRLNWTNQGQAASKENRDYQQVSAVVSR